MFGLKNGEVPAEFVLKLLPDLIKNLLKFEDRLVDYLPSNGWGTFEGLKITSCLSSRPSAQQGVDT